MRPQSFEYLVADGTNQRIDISRERRKGYANGGDCLSNFKMMAGIFDTLREYGAEPDLATPQGQCAFQVLHKLARRLNLMRKAVDIKESLRDTDLDMHNYIDLMYACEVDRSGEIKTLSE